ncbi:MAG TPA: sensor histidine kinase [Geobacter sp.]|nr:sensor histidine kinase [Geobacter sp.]
MKQTQKPCDTKTTSEVSSPSKSVEPESYERERVQEELYWLVDKLELRLTETEARLAETKTRLKKEEARRKKAQREANLLKDELARQTESVAMVNGELESFSYSISHDLRAPLRHVVGFSTALLEDYNETLDPAAQNYLDCVMRAGRKLEMLIEALLTLSRVTRQEVTPANVDLSQLARQCAASLQEAEPERQVAFKIADKLFANADPQLMRSALENLLGNAWKFTSQKGSATIEFGCKKEGNTTVYFVRDDGAGFDLRFADRLFGPFQRMHREGEFEGIGTGLAAVQRIIHKHGGRIWAEAEVDRGATFFFTLGAKH